MDRHGPSGWPLKAQRVLRQECSLTSARALSKGTSSGTAPKAGNALSSPSSQASCRSWRRARTCNRRD